MSGFARVFIVIPTKQEGAEDILVQAQLLPIKPRFSLDCGLEVQWVDLFPDAFAWRTESVAT
jgi:hypothetical protein